MARVPWSPYGERERRVAGQPAVWFLPSNGWLSVASNRGGAVPSDRFEHLAKHHHPLGSSPEGARLARLEVQPASIQRTVRVRNPPNSRGMDHARAWTSSLENYYRTCLSSWPRALYLQVYRVLAGPGVFARRPVVGKAGTHRCDEKKARRAADWGVHGFPGHLLYDHSVSARSRGNTMSMFDVTPNAYAMLPPQIKKSAHMYAITNWNFQQQQGRQLLDSVGAEELQRRILGDDYTAVAAALGPSKLTTNPDVAQARTGTASAGASAVAGPSRTPGLMTAARAARRAPSGSSGAAPLPPSPAAPRAIHAQPTPAMAAVVAPKRKANDTIDLTTPSPEPKRAR
jgi:hypothetical protein